MTPAVGELRNTGRVPVLPFPTPLWRSAKHTHLRGVEDGISYFYQTTVMEDHRTGRGGNVGFRRAGTSFPPQRRGSTATGDSRRRARKGRRWSVSKSSTGCERPTAPLVRLLGPGPSERSTGGLKSLPRRHQKVWDSAPLAGRRRLSRHGRVGEGAHLRRSVGNPVARGGALRSQDRGGAPDAASFGSDDFLREAVGLR